ncbi:MAG: hypothetical protein ACK58N_03955 [Synechocystis sp.]|jgi:hypothetical protein
MKTRFYAHGDQVEGNPEMFYCASCDCFIDRAHFETHNNEPNRLNNYQKYLSTLKTLQAYQKRSTNFYRPKNPYNLFH